MSTPVIRSISVNPPVVPPGGSATITVDAFDPDDGVATIKIEFTDGSGNKTEGEATIAVKDSLSASATTDRGTISQTGSFTFVWTDK